MKRTTKFTIETERVLVIRRRGTQHTSMCVGCGEVISFVTADEAAALAHVSSRVIYRLIEARKLHFIETAEESLLICINSLSQSLFETRIDLPNDANREGEEYEKNQA